MAKHKGASLQERLSRNQTQGRTAEIDLHQRFLEHSSEAEESGSLKLSTIQFRRPEELYPSPYNKIFEDLKGEEYWSALKKDISDAGAIIEPLLITQEGEIVSGHSRLKIVKELLAVGRMEFTKIPVRVILYSMTEDEKRSRVYLGNLSRFEMDQDTRLKLYSEIYPEYFHTIRKPGIQTATVAVSRIAESLGVKDRQVRNERQVYQKAKNIAEARGKDEPDSEEIRLAREQVNQARRERRKQKKSNPAIRKPDKEGSVMVQGDALFLDGALLLIFTTDAGAELRNMIIEYIKQWSGA